MPPCLPASLPLCLRPSLPSSLLPFLPYPCMRGPQRSPHLFCWKHMVCESETITFGHIMQQLCQGINNATMPINHHQSNPCIFMYAISNPTMVGRTKCPGPVTNPEASNLPGCAWLKMIHFQTFAMMSRVLRAAKVNSLLSVICGLWICSHTVHHDAAPQLQFAQSLLTKQCYPSHLLVILFQP